LLRSGFQEGRIDSEVSASINGLIRGQVKAVDYLNFTTILCTKKGTKNLFKVLDNLLLSH
jgi:hypothetical protein